MYDFRNTQTRARTYEVKFELTMYFFINTHTFVAATTATIPTAPTASSPVLTTSGIITTTAATTKTITTVTTAAITTVLTARPITCPRCGAKNDSGRSSCCGRGGAWFKNCGPPGDQDVDHTWLEGLQACKCKK